jgi:hypothetical protein
MKVSTRTFKLLACCAAAVGFSSPALAQFTPTSSLPTTVDVTLTAKCQFTSAGVAGNTLAFTASYTAFQAADVTSTLSPAVRCSRGVTAPTYGWNAVTPTASAVLTSNVAGLGYTLTATSSAVAGGVVASGGTGATANTGNLAVQLNIPGNQAGDTSASTTDSATLVVAF